MTWMGIDRIAGNQIAEHWAQLHKLGLLQQLEAIPVLGQAIGYPTLTSPHDAGRSHAMALAILFTPPSMTAEQYDEVIRQLETAGAGTPAGRRYHVCFGTGARLRVLDIWDSQEAFNAFGQSLMPILQQVGIDPGQPEIAEVHHIIAG